MIQTARKAVHWCDGNEAEAIDCMIDCMIDCRCGNCLRMIREDEKIYSPYFSNMPWDVITDSIEQSVAYLAFCQDCLVKLFGSDEATQIIEMNKGDDE